MKKIRVRYKDKLFLKIIALVVNFTYKLQDNFFYIEKKEMPIVHFVMNRYYLKMRCYNYWKNVVGICYIFT